MLQQRNTVHVHLDIIVISGIYDGIYLRVPELLDSKPIVKVGKNIRMYKEKKNIDGDQDNIVERATRPFLVGVKQVSVFE